MRRRRRAERKVVRAYAPGWDVPARFNFTRDVVEAHAGDPQRRALTFVDREGIVDRRTFAELAIEAARWAHLLRSRSVEGDRVMILLGKVPAWHGAMLGALKGGLVAVPCSEMLRGRDLAYRAEHSGAKLVVADRSCESEVAVMLEHLETAPEVVFLDEATHELRLHGTTAPTIDTAAADPALILYTSGTTKNPKGVTHSHAYTWAKRSQAEHWLDARPGDLVWCTAGTGWGKSIWNCLLGPWSMGSEVVLHDAPFDPAERVDLIERLGVTILCQAPTEFRYLVKSDAFDGLSAPRLRHAVAAGEPLDPEVIERVRDSLGIVVHDGYGQTENSLLVANLPGSPIRPGSMGLPTPGHDVSVIDDEGRVCPPGVEGDIALLGAPPTLFLGYWNAPEETAAVYREGWYVTGDRATTDEDGYVWFTGRADDVILSAAYRIGPFEVESALLEHPAVAESAVVGKPDPDRGQVVKAYVVLRGDYAPSDELVTELQAHAKAVTAPYKYPREIEFVDALPKTASGKIRRGELRERERALAEPRQPEVVEVETPDAARAEARRHAERLRIEEERRRAQIAERAAEAERAARARAEDYARREAAVREEEARARREREEWEAQEREAQEAAARADAARQEAERLEAERLEAERLEAERFEAEERRAAEERREAEARDAERARRWDERDESKEPATTVEAMPETTTVAAVTDADTVEAAEAPAIEPAPIPEPDRKSRFAQLAERRRAAALARDEERRREREERERARAEAEEARQREIEERAAARQREDEAREQARLQADAARREAEERAAERQRAEEARERLEAETRRREAEERETRSRERRTETTRRLARQRSKPDVSEESDAADHPIPDFVERLRRYAGGESTPTDDPGRDRE